MDTNKFRTRQEIERRTTHPKGRQYIIGLDAGYSSMKVFHENGYFCFPSYAKKIGDMLPVTNDRDIMYWDMETDEKYMLGYTAQDMAGTADTNDTDGEMFSRKRYGNRRFQILCQAAIAIAIMDKKDNREIVIQTGLPSAYVKADEKLMVKALSRPAHFKLKIGSLPWREFHFDLKQDNIYSNMPQPAGAFYSVLIRDDGTYVPDAKKYLFSNILVMDIGFGTFDFYGIKNREVTCVESKDEIGMRQVLKTTSKKILDEMNEDIRIQALQKCLETGKIICFDEEEMKTEERSIGSILEKANVEVFREAMAEAKGVTSSFRDYNNLIIGGGTGEAWYDMIREFLSGMKSLRVIPSNINDRLPFIYSNARGYYLYRYQLCKR